MKSVIAKSNWMPKRAAWLRQVGATLVAGDGRLDY
jgi:hypothetical protein